MSAKKRSPSGLLQLGNYRINGAKTVVGRKRNPRNAVRCKIGFLEFDNALSHTACSKIYI